MSAKKKKQSNSPLRVIIILVLLGLLAYKHQLFDGKLLENIPTIESNEEKPEILTSPQHGGALEIPMIQSSTGGQILKRKGYTLSYNADYKTPQWVAWELTKKETKGKEGRTNKFLPDPDVRGAKAYTGDYTKSGYDRGHMAPAADMKWNKQAMEESFYMSNICPQNPNLNRGDWNDLEEKSRQWAKKYGASKRSWYKNYRSLSHIRRHETIHTYVYPHTYVCVGAHERTGFISLPALR